MKVMNRLFEIAKMSKYSNYIDKKLIPAVNKEIGLSLEKKFNSDPFTLTYSSLVDDVGTFMDVTIRFTTNKKDIEGICWARFTIAGRNYEIGNIDGDLDYDLAIIEDSYNDFFDTLARKEVTLPNQPLNRK